MVWSISGYTARGGRKALNDPLRAYQFHTGRVNIFGGGSVNIQKNYYVNNCMPDMYYGYDTGSSGLMGWIKGLTIGGGILSGLGAIFGAIWGGGSKNVEGQGGTEETTVTTTEKEITALKEAYKDSCNIIQGGTGYYIKDKNGDVHEAKDLADLKTKLQALYPNKNTDAPKNTPKVVETLDETVSPIRAAQVEMIDENSSDVKSKEDFENVFSADFMKSHPYIDGKGLSMGNGVYCKTPDEAYSYLAGGNQAVKLSDVDFQTLIDNGTLIGVYDDGKDAKTNKGIADFDGAKLESINYKLGTNEVESVKIGGRDYRILNQNDQYVYLEDEKPSGGENNRQVYILEKTSNGKYQIHQRAFMGDKNIGINIPAETNRLGYWGIKS